VFAISCEQASLQKIIIQPMDNMATEFRILGRLEQPLTHIALDTVHQTAPATRI